MGHHISPPAYGNFWEREQEVRCEVPLLFSTAQLYVNHFFPFKFLRISVCFSRLFRFQYRLKLIQIVNDYWNMFTVRKYRIWFKQLFNHYVCRKYNQFWKTVRPILILSIMFEPCSLLSSRQKNETSLKNI